MNASILSMLAAPYILFAGIVGLIYRAVRQARCEQPVTGVTEDPAADSPHGSASQGE